TLDRERRPKRYRNRRQARNSVRPPDVRGNDRHTREARKQRDPRLSTRLTFEIASAFRKHRDRVAFAQECDGPFDGSDVAPLAVDRVGTQRSDQLPEERDLEELGLRHIRYLARQRAADRGRIEVRDVIGSDDEAPFARNVFFSEDAKPPKGEEEQLHEAATEGVQWRHGRAASRILANIVE